MKKAIALLLAIVLALSQFGCMSNREEEETALPDDEDEEYPEGGEEEYAIISWSGKLPSGDARILLDFCAEIARRNLNADESRAVSPVSVLYALGMTASGAQGETLSQLEEAIGLPVGSLNAFMKGYAAKLSENGGKVNLANSMWINEAYGLTYEPEFLNALKEYYRAEGFSGVFGPELCEKLNKWVSDNTYGMIKETLKEMDPEACMYIVNALALDLEWQFKYTGSFDGTFTREDGTEENCKMLLSTEYNFLKDEDTTGFIKHYKDGFAFVALLPGEGIAMEDYLKSLSGEKIVKLLENVERGCEVNTWVPEFDGDGEFDIADSLEDMGVTDLFDEDYADLRGISDAGGNNLFISEMLQKTERKFYSEGTKAAAAPYGVFSPNSIPYEVYLNRPFVYMILDPYENLPLFIGVVNSVA